MTNAGLLQNVKPLSPEQIIQLEDQILANNGFAFYLEPDGKIVLATGCWPISSEIKDIAWDKLKLLTTHEIKELKEEYLRTAGTDWVFNKAYYRNVGEPEWRLIVPKDTSLLGRALLGNMNLGRRY